MLVRIMIEDRERFIAKLGRHNTMNENQAGAKIRRIRVRQEEDCFFSGRKPHGISRDFIHFGYRSEIDRLRIAAVAQSVGLARTVMRDTVDFILRESVFISN